MIWWLACADPETTTPRGETEESEATGDTGIGATSPTGDTGTELVVTVDEDWERFLDAREDFLRDLGEPILDCVARQDTDHPAFHGCVDWHSAVHGTWALLALYRLTEDTVYLDAAEAVLAPEALEIELQDMQRGDLALELPYGFAWFLLLARERESTTGALDLLPLAEEAYAQLAATVDAIPLQQTDNYALSGEYDNLSWALLQLWEQAVWNGDLVEQERWEATVRDRLLPLDAACPLGDDAQSTGFFPPCLHRALAIATILPEDEAADWMADFLPPAFFLPPRTSFSFFHQVGQNFSRSWGLWTLWAASGDPQYRDAYMTHIATHMLRPEYWAENYALYSHWVAQFGVYGIALSYE